MSTAYVIEVRGETAGIIAREERGFRFYASSNRFNALEGEAFSSPRQAERAVVRLLTPRRSGFGARA